MQRLYEDIENKIVTATKLGRISEEVRLDHKGFSQWDSFSSRRDHDTIFQVLIHNFILHTHLYIILISNLILYLTATKLSMVF